MSKPFFSVLLPAFNARAHIGRALRDLTAQTFEDFEILVVDDGSTDGTGEAVRAHADPRIRLITLPENRGLVAALNEGLAEAKSPWVARQDADDRCRRDRLACQKELIGRNPGGVLFYSRATLLDGRGFWRGTLRTPVSDGELRWDLCFRNSVPHTSTVFPASLVRDELGGYEGDNVTADFDLWSRLLRKGRAAGDARCLVSYRNHGASIMGQENAARKKRSNEGLRNILRRNLRNWASATEEGAALIAATWLEPRADAWVHYLIETEKLVGNRWYEMKEIIGEEDYTLIHKALSISPKCAASFLAAMRELAPRRYAALPQPHTFFTRLLRGI